MKTAYYTFTTWNDGAMAAGLDSAVGEGRQAAMVRQSGQNSRIPEEEKIIDLTAWRAANPEQTPGEPEESVWDGEEFEWEQEEPSVSAPRLRRSHRAMLTAELVSTLSVVAVAAAIIVRVLTF